MFVAYDNSKTVNSFTMDINSRIDFIKQLEIETGELYSKKRVTKGTEQTLPVKAGEEQSFFAEKSLVSFASTVSGQLRRDVLQTVLLAQMAANKQFPEQEKLFEWYHVFLGVLTKVGWIVENLNEQNYDTAMSQFEMDNVIIDILSTTFGQNYILIIKKTLEAIKKMSDEDRKIKAFEKNTRSVSQRGFQIALANEDGGVVAIQIGTFMLDTSLDVRKILFFKTEKEETGLQYIVKRATLNSASYDEDIRKTVNAKIKDAQLTNISEIEI